MDSSSNTPNSSRSKSRQPSSPFNPFRLDTAHQMYVPNPMFAPPQLFNPQYGMGYPHLPIQNPNIPTQVAYNEFRYETQSVPETQDEAGLEAIPDTMVETQPETDAQGGSRRNQVAKKGREPNTKWTPEEEVALAKGWVDISEDNQVENSKKNASFWSRVVDYFHKETGKMHRTNHQLNSKWKTLNKQVGAFNAIYNNLLTSRRSGQSDADIKKDAYIQYRQIYKSNFVLEHAWDILRVAPKWAPVPPPPSSHGSSKRTKTSDSNTFSDAQAHPLDEETEDENEVEFFEPERPVGKKKGKRTVSSTSTGVSSENFNQLLKDLGGFRSSMDEYNTRLLEQNERRLCLQEEKELRKASQFLKQSDEGLEGEDLEIVQQAKDAIRKKYGLKK